MIFVRVLLVFLFVLSSSPAAAQAKLGEVHVESVDVDVVSLVVWVTDSSGNPVSGLTSEDFVVLEDGSMQEISNFSEVRSGSAAQDEEIPGVAHSADRKKVAILVDAGSLHPFQRDAVLDRLRTFARTLVRPGDEVLVAVWNESLDVVVPFTADPQELERALEGLTGRNTGRASSLMARKIVEQRVRGELNLALDRSSTVTMKDALKNSVTLGHMWAEQQRTSARAKAMALNGLLSTLSGVDGRKAMIYVGESLPARPGIELFQFIHDLFQPYVGEGPGEGVTLPQPETLAPKETTLLDSIAMTANANGVTMYMLDVSGSAGASATSAEDGAGRSTTVDFIEAANSRDASGDIAARTGGLAFTESLDVAGAFAAIERDFGSYYSLGYLAGANRPAGAHAVEVRARNEHHVVRTRSATFAKSALDEMVDRTVAELYYDDPSGDIDVSIVTGRPERVRRGTYRVPLTVLIPSDSVTLIPNGEYMSGTFSVFVGVGDGRGGVSGIERRRQAVNLLPAEAVDLAGKPFSFEMDLVLRKGENVLAVGVRDNISDLRGFGRSHLDVR